LRVTLNRKPDAIHAADFGHFCLVSAAAFAESWSGALVDFNCYASRERNVNPTDTLTHVDRDTNSEIRYCRPRAKTKVFAVVEPDGSTLKLEAGANAKAAEVVRKAGKESRIAVIVTGEMLGDTVTVDSISLAR
jgi:hypothetical protein